MKVFNLISTHTSMYDRTKFHTIEFIHNIPRVEFHTESLTTCMSIEQLIITEQIEVNMNA